MHSSGLANGVPLAGERGGRGDLHTLKLGAVKTEFGKFGEVLARTKKKLDEASSTIDLAQTRTHVMARKLKSVEALSDSRTQLLLPGAEAEPADDESA